jgi:hypothetical protein
MILRFPANVTMNERECLPPFAGMLYTLTSNTSHMGKTVSSLPSRPLRRAEVAALKEHDSIQALSPAYGDRPPYRDTAYILVFALETKKKAVAFTGKRWAVVGTRDIEPSPGEGISLDDPGHVDELHYKAAAFLNQQDEGITLEEKYHSTR